MKTVVRAKDTGEDPHICLLVLHYTEYYIDVCFSLGRCQLILWVWQSTVGRRTSLPFPELRMIIVDSLSFKGVYSSLRKARESKREAKNRLIKIDNWTENCATPDLDQEHF